jgi:rsbT co-antagonist protein RsbR
MSKLSELLQNHEAEILADWVKQLPASTRRKDLQSEASFQQEASDVLKAIAAASKDGIDTEGSNWKPVHDLLADIARSRATQGFTPTETAIFVFSLKQPIMSKLNAVMAGDPKAAFEEVWKVSTLIDRLGLFTVESTVSARDRVIARQQEEMLELSTPVVKLWDGVLALPLIGTLDSARTQVVMESLLSEIVSTNSRVAIIDITGVPTVDTLVAQHLLKTITAARLMGAECIISGIRPQIAQTIVHLGINLSDVVTKAKLSDAFAIALTRMGRKVVSGEMRKPQFTVQKAGNGEA